MSIGSAWQPTSAYQRYGDKVKQLALEFVREGECGRVRVRRAELFIALDELMTRNAALLTATETTHRPADRLQLRRELDTYQTYIRENQASLFALSESSSDDGRLGELLLALTLSSADEYLSESLSELAAAGGNDPNGDERTPPLFPWIDDGARALWSDCLTRDGVGFHVSHSIDTMNLARDLRRLLVHSAGIVTRDFIAKYAEFPAVIETRVRLPDDFMMDLLFSVGSLVGAVDHYVAHTIARAGRKGYLLRDP